MQRGVYTDSTLHLRGIRMKIVISQTCTKHYQTKASPHAHLSSSLPTLWTAWPLPLHTTVTTFGQLQTHTETTSTISGTSPDGRKSELSTCKQLRQGLAQTTQVRSHLTTKRRKEQTIKLLMCYAYYGQSIICQMRLKLHLGKVRHIP